MPASVFWKSGTSVRIPHALSLWRKAATLLGQPPNPIGEVCVWLDIRTPQKFASVHQRCWYVTRRLPRRSSTVQKDRHFDTQARFDAASIRFDTRAYRDNRAFSHSHEPPVQFARRLVVWEDMDSNKRAVGYGSLLYLHADGIKT